MEDLVRHGRPDLPRPHHPLCARCHDHKFDPIRQAEYYRLASALGGVRHGERDLLVESTPGFLSAIKRGRIEALAARIAAIEALGAPAQRANRRCPKCKRLDRPARADRGLGFRSRARRPPRATEGRAPPRSVPHSRGPSFRRQDGLRRHPPLRCPGRPEARRTLEAWVRLGNLDQRGGLRRSASSRPTGWHIRRDQPIGELEPRLLDGRRARTSVRSSARAERNARDRAADGSTGPRRHRLRRATARSSFSATANPTRRPVHSPSAR